MLAVCLICCSCKKEKISEREKLFDATRSVDTLYLTADGTEIIAPGTPEGAIVHPESNELAWEAFRSNNPDCPGQGSGDRPYLFTRPHPFAYVTDSGMVGYHSPETDDDMKKMEEYAEAKCPACLVSRNINTESNQTRAQYEAWCEKYVLEESAEELKRLAEEYEKLVRENQ